MKKSLLVSAVAVAAAVFSISAVAQGAGAPGAPVAKAATTDGVNVVFVAVKKGDFVGGANGANAVSAMMGSSGTITADQLSTLVSTCKPASAQVCAKFIAAHQADVGLGDKRPLTDKEVSTLLSDARANSAREATVHVNVIAFGVNGPTA